LEAFVTAHDRVVSRVGGSRYDKTAPSVTPRLSVTPGLLSLGPSYDEWSEVDMPFYLTRFSYTPETWARLAQKPEDRRDAARMYIEAVGGKLHGFWYAFGEYDAYNLWEAPDNVSMAAVAMAISGGGALSKYETTVLMTVEETLDAMQRARDIRYRPPGT
jgi:uncharacterized protein with GYD domain